VDGTATQIGAPSDRCSPGCATSPRPPWDEPRTNALRAAQTVQAPRWARGAISHRAGAADLTRYDGSPSDHSRRNGQECTRRATHPLASSRTQDRSAASARPISAFTAPVRRADPHFATRSRRPLKSRSWISAHVERPPAEPDDRFARSAAPQRVNAWTTIRGSGVLGAGRLVRRGSDDPFGLAWRDRIDDDGCVV
jgi:hypothetical protein